MRLTNTIREAFVRAVMNDVPQIDYEEQIVKVMQDDLAAQMPRKVRAVYDDLELRGWLNTPHMYVGHGVGYRYLYGAEGAITEQAVKEISRLGELLEAQEESREALTAKLTGVANSVTTRKTLVEALPEFEKYLPEEVISTKNLPAIANVVSDLVKAGWPKGQTKQASTTI